MSARASWQIVEDDDDQERLRQMAETAVEGSPERTALKRAQRFAGRATSRLWDAVDELTDSESGQVRTWSAAREKGGGTGGRPVAPMSPGGSSEPPGSSPETALADRPGAPDAPDAPLFEAFDCDLCGDAGQIKCDGCHGGAAPVVPECSVCRDVGWIDCPQCGVTA